MVNDSFPVDTSHSFCLQHSPSSAKLVAKAKKQQTYFVNRYKVWCLADIWVASVRIQFGWIFHTLLRLCFI